MCKCPGRQSERRAASCHCGTKSLDRWPWYAPRRSDCSARWRKRAVAELGRVACQQRSAQHSDASGGCVEARDFGTLHWLISISMNIFEFQIQSWFPLEHFLNNSLLRVYVHKEEWVKPELVTKHQWSRCLYELCFQWKIVSLWHCLPFFGGLRGGRHQGERQGEHQRRGGHWRWGRLSAVAWCAAFACARSVTVFVLCGTAVSLVASLLPATATHIY